MTNPLYVMKSSLNSLELIQLEEEANSERLEDLHDEKAIEDLHSIQCRHGDLASLLDGSSAIPAYN